MRCAVLSRSDPPVDTDCAAAYFQEVTRFWRLTWALTARSSWTAAPCRRCSFSTRSCAQRSRRSSTSTQWRSRASFTDLDMSQLPEAVPWEQRTTRITAGQNCVAAHYTLLRGQLREQDYITLIEI